MSQQPDFQVPGKPASCRAKSCRNCVFNDDDRGCSGVSLRSKTSPLTGPALAKEIIAGMPVSGEKK